MTLSEKYIKSVQRPASDFWGSEECLKLEHIQKACRIVALEAKIELLKETSGYFWYIDQWVKTSSLIKQLESELQKIRKEEKI